MHYVLPVRWLDSVLKGRYHFVFTTVTYSLQHSSSFTFPKLSPVITCLEIFMVYFIFLVSEIFYYFLLKNNVCESQKYP